MTYLFITEEDKLSQTNQTHYYMKIKIIKLVHKKWKWKISLQRWVLYFFDTEIIGVVFGVCLLFSFFYILSMNTMDPVPLKTVFKPFSLSTIWN